MKRMSTYFLPALGIGAMLFGLSYVWTGLTQLREGNMAAAALLTVFGIAGIAMGLALWNVARQFLRRKAPDDSPSPRP